MVTETIHNVEVPCRINKPTVFCFLFKGKRLACCNAVGDFTSRIVQCEIFTSFSMFTGQRQTANSFQCSCSYKMGDLYQMEKAYSHWVRCVAKRLTVCNIAEGANKKCTAERKISWLRVCTHSVLTIFLYATPLGFSGETEAMHAINVSTLSCSTFLSRVTWHDSLFGWDGAKPNKELTTTYLLCQQNLCFIYSVCTPASSKKSTKGLLSAGQIEVGWKLQGRNHRELTRLTITN